MLPGSCSPAEAVPRCSRLCAGPGTGVCGGVCPKQHNVQPRVTNAKAMSPDLNWSAMNNLTVSSLQLPIHITKVMYYRAAWGVTEAPVAPHALAANHSMVASLLEFPLSELLCLMEPDVCTCRGGMSRFLLGRGFDPLPRKCFRRPQQRDHHHRRLL